jgi:hypothetical protein
LYEQLQSPPPQVKLQWSMLQPAMSPHHSQKKPSGPDGHPPAFALATFAELSIIPPAMIITVATPLSVFCISVSSKGCTQLVTMDVRRRIAVGKRATSLFTFIGTVGRASGRTMSAAAKLQTTDGSTIRMVRVFSDFPAGVTHYFLRHDCEYGTCNSDRYETKPLLNQLPSSSMLRVIAAPDLALRFRPTFPNR